MDADLWNTVADKFMRGAPSSEPDDPPVGASRRTQDDIAASSNRTSLCQVVAGSPSAPVRFHSRTVEQACGRPELLLQREPLQLVESCDDHEELVLFLACASRTLQFYCGGHERNEFRWQLVQAALKCEPALLDHHPAFIVFSAVENEREPPLSALNALQGSACPADIHAAAHGHARSDWLIQFRGLMPDLHVATSDSRIRHIIAHVLVRGAHTSPGEAAHLFRLHFTQPTAPGTAPSVIRDAVPVLLALERSFGSDLNTEELWHDVGLQARQMGFGQEWALTEACRIVALLRAGIPHAALGVALLLQTAADLLPTTPGLTESAALSMTIASGQQLDAQLDFACLGGSREQYQFLQTALTAPG